MRTAIVILLLFVPLAITPNAAAGAREVIYQVTIPPGTSRLFQEQFTNFKTFHDVEVSVTCNGGVGAAQSSFANTVDLRLSGFYVVCDNVGSAVHTLSRFDPGLHRVYGAFYAPEPIVITVTGVAL